MSLRREHFGSDPQSGGTSPAESWEKGTAGKDQTELEPAGQGRLEAREWPGGISSAVGGPAGRSCWP